MGFNLALLLNLIHMSGYPGLPHDLRIVNEFGALWDIVIVSRRLLARPLQT